MRMVSITAVVYKREDGVDGAEITLNIGKTLFIPGFTERHFELLNVDRPIQEALFDIPQEYREFFITGYTPKEWQKTFSPSAM